MVLRQTMLRRQTKSPEANLAQSIGACGAVFTLDGLPGLKPDRLIEALA